MREEGGRGEGVVVVEGGEGSSWGGGVIGG